MQLNDSQKNAVEFGAGPLMVVAGPGTGKTKVIVERIKHLIESGVEPSKITAITFTEKAAEEMQTRLNELLGYYCLDINIATFNAFGYEILKRYGIDIGLSPNLQILNENSLAFFMQQNLSKYQLKYYKPIGNPTKFIPQLIKFFQNLKQQAIFPDDFAATINQLPGKSVEERLEKERLTELAANYKIHFELTKEQGVIDYDDQIFLCLHLFNLRPNVLKKVQDASQHLLIDEFQDTNTMQFQLASMIAKPNNNLTVVGDDDQAIYGFRGANIENILNFKDHFPAAQEIVLTDNYRSSSDILDKSYKLIQNNNPDRLESILKINKHLTAHIENNQEVEQINAYNQDHEAVEIAQTISKLIKSKQFQAQEIAILVRKSAQTAKIALALSQENIDYHEVGKVHDLFSSSIVVDSINILKFLANPIDNFLLYKTLSSQFFNLYSQSLADANALSSAQHQSLQKIIEEGEDDKLKDALKKISEWRSFSAKNDVGKALYHILQDSGLQKILIEQAENDEQALQQLTSVAQLFELISDFLLIAADKTVEGFLENLQLLKDLAQQEPDTIDLSNSEQKVTITTIHKSKGLEWEVVFVPGLIDQTFPARLNHSSQLDVDSVTKTLSKEQHLQEERRLAYVAMTRARQRLVLSNYQHSLKGRPIKPSIFIVEIFDEKPTSATTTSQPNKNLNFAFSADASLNQSQEIAIPKNILDGEWVNLTPTQISNFLRCPYDFFYRSILKVPNPNQSASNIGTAVHFVVEQFNKDRVEQSLKPISKYLKLIDDLLKTDSFSSLEEREESIKRIKQRLKIYLEGQLQAEHYPSHNEQSFNVTLEKHKIKLRGKIDAIYDYDDYLEIRDYKTSSTNRSEKNLKGQSSKSVQLTVYAFAWYHLTGRLADKITLDYVLTNQISSSKKQLKTIEGFTDKLDDIASKIRNKQFDKGYDHTYCRHDLSF